MLYYVYFFFQDTKKLTYKVFIYTGGDVINNSFLTLVNSNNNSSNKTPVKKSGEVRTYFNTIYKYVTHAVKNSVYSLFSSYRSTK